jgi:hypothetical protein
MSGFIGHQEARLYQAVLGVTSWNHICAHGIVWELGPAGTLFHLKMKKGKILVLQGILPVFLKFQLMLF